jgi:lysophospholipase L1-like esterase
MPAPPSARRAVSLVVVPCALALLLLGLLEGGCRAALRLKTGRWPQTRAASYRAFVEEIGAAYERHPYLVVDGRPNAVLSVPGHVAHMNARGQRGAAPEIPKPRGRFRIVCEGGSTTFDLLAADDAHTWPALLGSLLAPRNTDVVNAGFPGWTTVESLVSLELKDVDVAPDLVLVFAGANDLQPAGHEPFTRDYSKGHGELLPRVLGVAPIPLRLASRSVFVETLLDRMRRGPERPEGWAPAWEWSGGPRKDDVSQDAVDVFVRNLRSTIGVARAHGARTVFVAQSVRVRKGRESSDDEYLMSWTPGLTPAGVKKGLARYTEAERALATEAGELFLDPSGGLEDDDYADPLHFSAKGSDRFAKLLDAWITERLEAFRVEAEQKKGPGR